MKKILIVFSSVDGHTFKISNKIKDIFIREGHGVDIISIDKYSKISTEYDFILIGASIRYGNYRKSFYEFIKKNFEVLSNVKTGFFSVSATARKIGKDKPEKDKYFQKMKIKSGFQPDFIAIFAGSIKYPEYNFFDRYMIQFIMSITAGPTDLSNTFEFTDWNKVNLFGLQISNELKKLDIKSL